MRVGLALRRRVQQGACHDRQRRVGAVQALMTDGVDPVADASRIRRTVEHVVVDRGHEGARVAVVECLRFVADREGVDQRTDRRIIVIGAGQFLNVVRRTGGGQLRFEAGQAAGVRRTAETGNADLLHRLQIVGRDRRRACAEQTIRLRGRACRNARAVAAEQQRENQAGSTREQICAVKQGHGGLSIRFRQLHLMLRMQKLLPINTA